MSESEGESLTVIEKYTIDFFPVMVEGEDSGEYIVRERHGLRGCLQHHPHKFFDVSNEETIRGSSDPLL